MFILLCSSSIFWRKESSVGILCWSHLQKKTLLTFYRYGIEYILYIQYCILNILRRNIVYICGGRKKSEGISTEILQSEEYRKEN